MVLIIDLSQEKIFKESQLEINSKINYILGKNGTGKTTFSRLIKEQNPSFDVRIFDGFRGVLGSNERLNAVVLGEENTVIDAQIERIRKNIETLQEEKERIKSTITQPYDDSDNLWTDWNKKKINTEDLSKKLDNGKSKEQIIYSMKNCFLYNNALSHFESYWETE
jgi:ATPase subunit of ABC transporter with duplicated ATPase domains